MINLEAGAHSVGEPVHVEPSNNIFTELGNNTYDYKDLLSELIDNSLAAGADGQFVRVTVTLGLSQSDPTKS